MDFLGFSRLNLDFSMGYARFSLKVFSMRCLGAGGAGTRDCGQGWRKRRIVHVASLTRFLLSTSVVVWVRCRLGPIANCIRVDAAMLPRSLIAAGAVQRASGRTPVYRRPMDRAHSAPAILQFRVRSQFVLVAKLGATMLRKRGRRRPETPLAEGPALGFVRCDWIRLEAEAAAPP